jgi:hypothetical protein
LAVSPDAKTSGAPEEKEMIDPEHNNFTKVRQQLNILLTCYWVLGRRTRYTNDCKGKIQNLEGLFK